MHPASQGPPIVSMRAVDKAYAVGDVRVPILEKADLDVAEGELVVVFGVSGTGKTTLLNLLGALDVPDAGSLRVDGQELSALSESDRTEFRRRKLGFVFQFYNLLPTLNARENVESAVELLGLPRREVSERALSYLERVGMADKAGKYPDQLSGGEQQRVAIARALAKRPRLLLADEPTGNLDEQTAGQVSALFEEMNRSTGTTLLVVTHNPRIQEIAHRVITIERRKVRAGR